MKRSVGKEESKINGNTGQGKNEADVLLMDNDEGKEGENTRLIGGLQVGVEM